MIVLSGKEVGAAIEAELSAQVAALSGAGVQPCLAVVLVGEAPESKSYVATKLKMAQRLGIRSVDRFLPESTSQAELEAEIARLNADPTVHAILCQLPLPPHLDFGRIAPLVDPAKDADCFHPHNFGLLAQGLPRFVPCTPAGIVAILRHYDIKTKGREVVVMGRSNIVGRPISLLLSAPGCDATVTVCHLSTRNLERHTLAADILIVAIGHPKWVGPQHVKEGAVVIDVGINRVDDSSRPRGYRIVGDVDYEAVAERCAAITPVPGGVGPLTVLMLMRNTVIAAQLAAGLALGPDGGVK